MKCRRRGKQVGVFGDDDERGKSEDKGWDMRG
jgi:hypothetical protein